MKKYHVNTSQRKGSVSFITRYSVFTLITSKFHLKRLCRSQIVRGGGILGPPILAVPEVRFKPVLVRFEFNGARIFLVRTPAAQLNKAKLFNFN